LNLPPPTDLAVAALRWLEYAGLLGFVGVVVVRRLAAMRPEITWARPSMQPALAAAFVGGLAVVSIEALRAGHPSVFGVVRVAAEGVALGLCLYGHRLLTPHSPQGRGGSLVVPPGIFAAAALAFAGHAASVNPGAGAIFADATHVLSAGAWAGGILVLATLRPPDGWRGDEGRAMIQRFGRVAFLAFTITALTGVLRATEELRGVDDLWGTPYGLVLSLKTAGVLVMVAMSVLVWRRGFQYARAEGALVLIVLAATAMLAAFPMPPGQA
jgi:putative copper export protein